MTKQTWHDVINCSRCKVHLVQEPWRTDKDYYRVHTKLTYDDHVTSRVVLRKHWALNDMDLCKKCLKEYLKELEVPATFDPEKGYPE